MTFLLHATVAFFVRYTHTNLINTISRMEPEPSTYFPYAHLPKCPLWLAGWLADVIDALIRILTAVIAVAFAEICPGQRI